MEEYPHRELTEQIIGAAIAVHRALGPGFLESIYENALCHELRKRGLSVEQQRSVPVIYDGVKVGEHRLDLIVEQCVLLELKAVESVSSLFDAQVISTLRASQVPVGLLINFNMTLLKNGIKRFAITKNGNVNVD